MNKFKNYLLAAALGLALIGSGVTATTLAIATATPASNIQAAQAPSGPADPNGANPDPSIYTPLPIHAPVARDGEPGVMDDSIYAPIPIQSPIARTSEGGVTEGVVFELL